MNWQTLTEEALSIQFDHVKNNDMAQNAGFHQTTIDSYEVEKSFQHKGNVLAN